MRRALVLLLGASLVLTACTAQGKTAGWTYPPASPGSAAAATPTPAASASTAPSSSATSTLEVTAFDLGFKPAKLEVPAAGHYTVKLINTGSTTHDITFASGEQAVAKAGETASVDVDIPAAGVSFLCSIPGHADAGMKGDVVIAGTAVASPSAKPDDHGGPAPATDVQADPNAPAPVRYDPTAPKLLAGSVHDIDLVMTEVDMTVATGFVQHVWTFGGTVPGPAIRVKVGDKIRVHLKNPATNKMAHSIDFHASQVAWNDEMTSIEPGQEKLYEWTAEYAGVWMYHCGTAPALHHIANGMYGMVIVEPAAGLAPVDKEFALVQSEWYLGPQGQPVDLTKASAGAPAPDFVVFNGVANQYKDGPIEVATGKRVRIFVLDAGPNIDSSFHIVGTIFDTVIKEGIALTKGNQGSWGSQAMDLSPAQGGIVEFATAEDGLYPIVTHAFNFVGRGALGLLKSGDGDPFTYGSPRRVPGANGRADRARPASRPQRRRRGRRRPPLRRRPSQLSRGSRRRRWHPRRRQGSGPCSTSRPPSRRGRLAPPRVPRSAAASPRVPSRARRWTASRRAAASTTPGRPARALPARWR
jgi:nitrite reductase (NO-forming)